MPCDYQASFEESEAGAMYDAGQYAPGSYWEVLWQIEMAVLDEVVRKLREKKSYLRYLDFACGTGRVLAHLEGGCDESMGIDVSKAMLARARTRVRRATLLCKDIAAPDAIVEGQYDLITAFRFLLNAQAGLRESGLRALVARLWDRESRLVVNLHGNLASYKALLAPWRALSSRVTGRPTENLLWPSAVTQLLHEVGLDIVETHGMGILPGAVLQRIPNGRRVGVERWLRSIRPLSRLGVNQIYICRLSRDKWDAGSRKGCREVAHEE